MKIAERTEGYREVLNTRWPILTIVEKVGREHFRVTYGICNGIAGGSKDYRTKREALRNAGITE